MKLISLKEVWLKYQVEFKENGKSILEDFWALKGINIEIDRGEVVAIIGENGAGKTTTLKVIAGMLKPDKGVVKINGTVSTLMEIGAGFHKDLTGKENIYYISSLFGLSKKEIDKRYNDIVDFAAIGRFINAPVRVYSQGMYMRLAFAIAIHVDPGILLIDDTFVVGDIYAQRKCINKIFELKKQGKTIIFVSQDIHMAKRLCTRGIFIREGKIVREGSIDGVCSYYEESVGDKKGIAILQRGPLGIVFNNGKIVLRWKDRTATSYLSGHSLMFSSGRQYLSIKGDWQAQESETGREIVAVGKWADFPVTQHWKIILLNESEFLWEINMSASKAVSMESFRASFIFRNEYTSWLTLETKADFPTTFIHPLEWDCSVINDSSARVIGLRGNKITAEPLPVIIFDRLHDNLNAICQVGNTGSDVNGRAILYEIYLGSSMNNCIQGQYRCFSTKVKIFDSEEGEELKLYLANSKQLLRESAIIRKDSLSLFCRDRNIEIYWQDKLLTRGIGLNTKFRCHDKNHSAAGGHWVINKENNEEIVISIYWDDISPLNQLWRLKLQDNNVILWEVKMEVSEEVTIRNKETELVLSGEYERWITVEEDGDFERLENRGKAVILNKYINEEIGTRGVYRMNDFILPGLVFSYEDLNPRASYISQAKTDIMTTTLRYLEVDFKENFYTSRGRYEYFKGKIKVTDDRKEGNKTTRIIDKKPLISKKGIKALDKIELNTTSLIFTHGKGKLFWKGKELTKGLGLYSSIFFQDRWYDSSQAFWEIEKLNTKRFVAIGRWPEFSLTQTWEIGILDEKTLSWKITNEIWDDVVLERAQVNLMLSDRYKKWFTYRRIHGKFPERFGEHSGTLWDRLWSGSGVLPIGVKKCTFNKGILNRVSLPSLVFQCSIDCPTRNSVIENTDDLFQARLLQYELDLNLRKRINAEKNKYFEGLIKIIK